MTVGGDVELGKFPAAAMVRPAELVEEEEEAVVIEQVALTVDTDDDPTLPVWTFRMWSIGLLSCVMLSFLNQFFSYRTETLIITAVTAQIVALPIGRFMAAVLPTTIYTLPFTAFKFSLNPGPFNRKEHVLITIFANAGTAFSNGNAYAVGIVDLIKVFYKRSIQFHTGLALVITTQVLGYGWAGLLRKYLVDSPSMWWPANMVQVSLFRALHDPETKETGRLGVSLSRSKFFLMVMFASFSYYILPGYLFLGLTSVSWICWALPKSVLAQQLGSGMHGLGIGAIGLDWASAAGFLGSPLVTPLFALVNGLAGYLLIVYVMLPIFYWGNVFEARRFPIYSTKLFQANGSRYDIHSVINSKFEMDWAAYEKQGPIHMSAVFSLAYGISFATIASTLTHVIFFHGKEILNSSRTALNQRLDIHGRLMKKYATIPNSWFVALMVISVAAAIATCEIFKSQLQLPWWGVLLSCALAFAFTLPVGVIAATTNIVPGLNVITEYIIGYLLPGKPVANVCFKTYGYMSMSQAVSFLQDFKLGHYMKIPPRSMFVVQVVGTIVAATVNMAVAWYMLTNINNICNLDLLPENSPWTCPNDQTFYSASIIWGLVSPKRIFGSLGEYKAMSWFFLVGAAAPIPFWFLARSFPQKKWLKLINVPVILGATSSLPPATTVNYSTYFTLGLFFNYFVFKYHKGWWSRYNYVLSAGLDAGVAFMAVAIYFALGMPNKNLNWWGTSVDHCPLATCPTQPGIVVDGCPVFL